MVELHEAGGEADKEIHDIEDGLFGLLGRASPLGFPGAPSEVGQTLPPSPQAPGLLGCLQGGNRKWTQQAQKGEEATRRGGGMSGDDQEKARSRRANHTSSNPVNYFLTGSLGAAPLHAFHHLLGPWRELVEHVGWGSKPNHHRIAFHVLQNEVPTLVNFLEVCSCLVIA